MYSQTVDFRTNYCYTLFIQIEICGGIQMERIEAFELMLCDIQKQAAYEEEQMQKLKAAGKEKSATYRQFFGNRFFYKQMLNTYKKYGLIE